MMIAAFIAAFVMTVPFGMAAKADEHCSGEDDVGDSMAIPSLNDYELDPSVAFLYDYDILMTAAIADEDVAEYVLDVVNKVKVNYEYSDVFGFVGNQMFFDSIAAATKQHYGITYTTLKQRVSAARYVLQDSAMIGSWSDSFESYDCYSYVLGRTGGIGRMPGFMTGQDAYTREYLKSGKFDQIAGFVVGDLKELGKCCTGYTKSLPTTSSLNSFSGVMCLRMTSSSLLTPDFHFMGYYKSVGQWRHKPGATAVLRYLYSPVKSRIWTNENVKADGAHAGTREYTSDIYYIQYNNSHKRTYTYSRPSSTHTGRCSVCGDVVQQAHVLNSSQSACSICGCPAQFIVKSQSVQDWRVLDKYLLPKEDKKGV